MALRGGMPGRAPRCQGAPGRLTSGFSGQRVALPLILSVRHLVWKTARRAWSIIGITFVVVFVVFTARDRARTGVQRGRAGSTLDRKSMGTGRELMARMARKLL